MGVRVLRYLYRFLCVYICVIFSAYADDFYSFGAPLCGYGQYRYNSQCYDIAVDNPDAQCMGQTISGTSCLNAVEIVVARENPEIYPFEAGFSAVGYATDTESTVASACGGNGVTGTTCLNIVTQVAANELPALYPFDAGFSAVGYAITNYATAQTNDCLGTMTDYYAFETSAFSKMTNASCASTATRYDIPNDCQYIDTTSTDASDIRSGANPDNWMCGVLCDTGYVYTGTGACSQYCNTDGQNRRLHIMRDGEHFSYPLYTDALTTPAIHLSIPSADGLQSTTCHVNLLPDRAPNSVVVKYQNKEYHGSH